jgi:hypothetical protein
MQGCYRLAGVGWMMGHVDAHAQNKPVDTAARAGRGFQQYARDLGAVDQNVVGPFMGWRQMGRDPNNRRRKCYRGQK